LMVSAHNDISVDENDIGYSKLDFKLHQMALKCRSVTTIRRKAIVSLNLTHHSQHICS
jgi:hypothetical protein